MILTVVLILAGWVVASVPVALVTGRVLARRSRAYPPPAASSEDREAA